MTPAVERAAMMRVIEFALEAIQHVIDLGEAGFLQRFAGLFGAVAAAANQDHRPVVRGRHTHLAHEVWVERPVDAVVPRDQNCAHRMADEQKFEFRTAIDEDGLGVGVQEIVRFFWREMVHASSIGETGGIGACAIMSPFF